MPTRSSSPAPVALLATFVLGLLAWLGWLAVTATPTDQNHPTGAEPSEFTPPDDPLSGPDAATVHTDQGGQPRKLRANAVPQERPRNQGATAKPSGLYGIVLGLGDEPVFGASVTLQGLTRHRLGQRVDRLAHASTDKNGRFAFDQELLLRNPHVVRCEIKARLHELVAKSPEFLPDIVRKKPFTLRLRTPPPPPTRIVGAVADSKNTVRGELAITNAVIARVEAPTKALAKTLHDGSFAIVLSEQDLQEFALQPLRLIAHHPRHGCSEVQEIVIPQPGTDSTAAFDISLYRAELYVDVTGPTGWPLDVAPITLTCTSVDATNTRPAPPYERKSVTVFGSGPVRGLTPGHWSVRWTIADPIVIPESYGESSAVGPSWDGPSDSSRIALTVPYYPIQLTAHGSGRSNLDPRRVAVKALGYVEGSGMQKRADLILRAKGGKVPGSLAEEIAQTQTTAVHLLWTAPGIEIAYRLSLPNGRRHRGIVPRWDGRKTPWQPIISVDSK